MEKEFPGEVVILYRGAVMRIGVLFILVNFEVEQEIGDRLIRHLRNHGRGVSNRGFR